MKNILLLFIFSAIIGACSNQTTNDPDSTVSSSSKDSLTSRNKKDSIQINTNLPFGCSELIKHKYPKKWKADLSNYGQLLQPEGKEFENIGQCFEKINGIISTSDRPEILKVEPLKISKNLSNVNFDSVLQGDIDSLKYRLPNIGKYQCYYFYAQSQKNFGLYGNLVLLNPESREAKLLNVYYQVGGEQHVSFRYFYMEGREVRIYQGSCYDDGCDLSESFIVKIKLDGQIMIEELK